MPDPAAPLRDETPLAAADREAFHNAILASFRDPADLEILLSHKWGVRLSDQVFLAQPGRRIAKELLDWVADEGRERELLGLLWTARPQNPILRPLAERLLGDLAPVAARYDAAPAAIAAAAPVVETSRGNLEKVVTERSRLNDFAAFVARLERIAPAVCKVETPLETGTGFLVGRRHVLTNNHVVKGAAAMGALGEQIACRFDYAVGPDGQAAAGLALPALPGGDWLIAHSPHSQSDIDGAGSPAPGELDYALIRLAADADAARSHLELGTIPPIVTPLDIAIVVQHPGGDPLKIAMGVVTELPASGLRYRYNTTTKGGASGAPVFSADVGLIGLHHAADPAKAPQYNQAVPVWRVARALADAGHDPAAL